MPLWNSTIVPPGSLLVGTKPPCQLNGLLQVPPDGPTQRCVAGVIRSSSGSMKSLGIRRFRSAARACDFDVFDFRPQRRFHQFPNIVKLPRRAVDVRIQPPRIELAALRKTLPPSDEAPHAAGFAK